jgi:deazaflavin-dependent oxidoreductase (nitroreductase family)
MARYTPSLYPRERRYNPFIREQKMTVLGVGLHGGRILSALELPWFILLPPRGFGVLTTIGRKSGKLRRKCVRATRCGDSVYLVSIGGPDIAWLKNIQANPNVFLRIPGGTFTGRARELTDPLEAERVLRVGARRGLLGVHELAQRTPYPFKDRRPDPRLVGGGRPACH